MPLSLKNLVLSSFQGLTIDEILELPPSAIKGISEADSQKLYDAFRIKSVADLANNELIKKATTIKNMSYQTYDPGPSEFWVDKFSELPNDYYKNHLSGRFRDAFDGINYRGRLDGTAKVIIVGQDPSTDEAIARRAFVGSAGQLLQKLLNKLGLIRSYVIINTFAYSINGQFDNQMRLIAQEDEIKNYRNSLLDGLVAQNNIEVVITLGVGPREALGTWSNATNIPVVNLTHPSARQGVAANWNSNLVTLETHITPDDSTLVDLTPYVNPMRQDANMSNIPRFDLPYGIPDFHGTKGTNSRRDPSDRINNIIWESI